MTISTLPHPSSKISLTLTLGAFIFVEIFVWSGPLHGEYCPSKAHNHDGSSKSIQPKQWQHWIHVQRGRTDPTVCLLAKWEDAVFATKVKTRRICTDPTISLEKQHIHITYVYVHSKNKFIVSKVCSTKLIRVSVSIFIIFFLLTNYYIRKGMFQF